MKPTPILVLALASALLLAPSAAQAKVSKLVLFSKPIVAQAYVAEQHGMLLRPNGVEAPDVPGYVTGVKSEIVSTRSANAKALSPKDVMIHHLVYGAPGAEYAGRHNCGGRFFGRGEEAQTMPEQGEYGISNRTADGRAPSWFLAHMLMNHRSKDKTVYVRTRVTYTDEPRKPVDPLWLDTKGCAGDPVFDVPGGGRKGSTFRDDHTFTVPFDGRIVGAGGHLHGGGKYVDLENASCGDRLLVRSRAYYGMPDHPFYTARPILHEPGPAVMGTYVSEKGIPVSQGDRLRLSAVYDNEKLHGRVMSIMMTYIRRGEVDGCQRPPGDLTLVDKPRRFRKDPPDFDVPLVSQPTGPFRRLGSNPLDVGSFRMTPWRVRANLGETVRWSFAGPQLHDVTVVDGPRGFSSPWLGRGGSYSHRPTKRGTYKIFCSLHPGQMTQELKVK